MSGWRGRPRLVKVSAYEHPDGNFPPCPSLALGTLTQQMSELDAAGQGAIDHQVGPSREA